MVRMLAGIALLLGTALAGVGIATVHFHSADSGTLRIIAAKGEPLHGRHVRKDDLRRFERPKNTLSEDALTPIEALPREGTRAFAAPVADGVGGRSIRPGDRVDVILTKTEDGQPVTRVIMQDVTVIAVDRELDQDQPWSGRSTGTIEVTPGQAQQLLLAIRVGKLRLMLRGVRETTMGGFLRPLCRDFDPQSKSLWGRCRSANDRFRGTQTVEESPERFEEKRRQLEEQQQLAEELRRLEEEGSHIED